MPINLQPARLWPSFLPKPEFLRRVYGNYLKNRSLYPIELPEVKVEPELDFLLVELPPRYLPMMPNGLGYVTNILKKSGVKYQTLDLNIISYHRYHSKRMEDGKPPVVGEGYEMKENPWDNSYTSEWERLDVVEHFWPDVQELLDQVVEKKPKAIGISITATSRTISNQFIQKLRVHAPDTMIVVGGYDCTYSNVGPYLIPDYDYMCIGEGEATLEPLLKALQAGERPKNLKGIFSKFDTEKREKFSTPLLFDLNSIDFPKYDWLDSKYYRTFNKDHLVPITATRGCRWSLCRFCAECFTFRKREPKLVVDEMEFMYKKGFHKFHFNESDVNGDPETLYEICSEIIRRNLKLRLMGQLRIDRHNTPEYFKHLKRAGFHALRFGVDGWSDHAIRLQKKGYRMRMVIENLRDCKSIGIWTTVNMVIGVPGETEQDIDEYVQNLVACKDYIDEIEGLNTLILSAGSEYYNNPDAYKIKFRGNKEELYKKYPYVIPYDFWYSEDPYIDQRVRLKRMNRMCEEAYDQGLGFGTFATRVVQNLKQQKLDEAAAGSIA